MVPPAFSPVPAPKLRLAKVKPPPSSMKSSPLRKSIMLFTAKVPLGASPMTKKSVPAPPVRVFAPRFPKSRSFPEPPEMRSLPCPPNSTSSPSSPEMTSSPWLPKAKSLPGPLKIRSFPATSKAPPSLVPPIKTSLPRSP